MCVLEEFNISKKIIALITDNESAILVCRKEIALALNDEFSLLTFSHYRCAAHVLNLGVQKKLKLISNSISKIHNLISKIKNSTCLCNDLHLLYNIKKIKYLKSILDIEMHW